MLFTKTVIPRASLIYRYKKYGKFSASTNLTEYFLQHHVRNRWSASRCCESGSDFSLWCRSGSNCLLWCGSGSKSSPLKSETNQRTGLQTLHGSNQRLHCGRLRPLHCSILSLHIYWILTLMRIRILNLMLIKIRIQLFILKPIRIRVLKINWTQAETDPKHYRKVPIPHHEAHLFIVHMLFYAYLMYGIQYSYCTENFARDLMRTCSMSGSIFNSIRLCLRRAVSFWDLKEKI